MIAEVRIPEERVGALIGVKRKALLLLEGKTKTQMSVEENVVTIDGEPENVWTAKEVVKAVGRGFAPPRALSLLEGRVLDIINIEGGDKAIKRIKSRIIGREGRTRKILERMTGAYISVYGKTVAFICSPEDADRMKKAMEMFIKGSNHGAVYKFLYTGNKLRRMMGNG